MATPIYAQAETFPFLVEDDAYISRLEISQIVDGTVPFDGRNDPGYDASPSNNIVRSFDYITYNLVFNTQTYNAYNDYKGGYVIFEATLPVDYKKAVWDTENMLWMATDSSTISQGGYGWEIKTNTDGSQTLYAAAKLTSPEGNQSAIPGSGSRTFTVQVLGAANGDVIKPVFKAYLDVNDVAGDVCQTHGQSEIRTVVGEDVVVSAKPSVDVHLVMGQSGRDHYTTLNFDTGNSDTASNYGLGEINGMTFQVVSRVALASIPDGGGGMKGVEFLSGDINFDVEFECYYVKDSDPLNPISLPEDYKPLLYDSNYILTVNSGVEWFNGRTLDFTETPPPESHVPNHVARAHPERWAQCGSINGDSYTQSSWHDGEYSIQQKSNGSLSVLNNEYEINPLWFPSGSGNSTGQAYDFYSPPLAPENVPYGVFTSATSVFLLPDYYRGTRLADIYGNGSIKVVAKDVNLQAAGLSGQKLQTVSDNSNQTHLNNDEVILTLRVEQVIEGSWRKEIFYTIDSSPQIRWADVYNTSSYITRGDQALPAGSAFGARAIQYNSVATDAFHNRAVGMDTLLKFDDAALIIDANKTNAIYNTVSFLKKDNMKLLYAAKPDKTGWNHNGLSPSDTGYDDEMLNAQINDLIYFESLEALESSGYTCVATLSTYRYNPATDAEVFVGSQASNITIFNIKADTSLIGNVYAINAHCVVWRYGTVENPSNIPTVQTIQSGNATWNDYYAEATINNNTSNYIKSVWEDGKYVSGHNGGKTLGDSIYILPYSVAISKTVEQTAYDSSGVLNPKKTYDVSAGENIVDYALNITTTQSEVDNIVSTTYTVMDRLPKGIDFVDGSAVFGGSYQGGKIVGGTPMTPSKITENADGTTDVTFVFDYDVVPTLPTIHFKAQIDPLSLDPSLSNNSFVNTATVTTPEDNDEPTFANRKQSSYTIQVPKLDDVSVSKRAHRRKAELNQQIGYDITWSNNNDSDLVDAVMLDVMPKITNSEFDGSYSTKSINITNLNDAASYELYYTTDEKGSSLLETNGSEEPPSRSLSKNSIANGTVDAQSGYCLWTKTNLGNNPIPDNATAWCLIGTLPSEKRIDATIIMQPSNNKADNYYLNSAAIKSAYSVAKTQIIDRSVNGQIWMDSNRNGLRENQENNVSGVTIGLCDENGRIIRSLADNTELRTTVAEDGKYCFTGVPSGKYRVVILSDISKYSVTSINVGDDDDIDSDFVKQNNAISSAELTFPDVADVESSFAINNVDLGLFASKLSITKEIDGVYFPDDEFNFTIELLKDETYSGLDMFTADNIAGLNRVSENTYAFTLKANETIEIPGIPDGYSYRIEEVYNSNWKLVEATNASGTISNDTASVFTNTKLIAFPFTGGNTTIPMVLIPILLIVSAAFIVVNNSRDVQ